jgi:hypothetical protein
MPSRTLRETGLVVYVLLNERVDLDLDSGELLQAFRVLEPVVAVQYEGCCRFTSHRRVDVLLVGFGTLKVTVGKTCWAHPGATWTSPAPRLGIWPRCRRCGYIRRLFDGYLARFVYTV